MKNQFLWAMVCLFFSVCTAKGQVFIDGGLGTTQMNQLSPNDSVEEYPQSDNWYVGIGLQLGGKQLSLRPSVRYMNSLKIYEGLDSENERYRNGFELAYLQIPLQLKYAFTRSAVRPYVVAGPVLHIPIESTIPEFTDAIQKQSYAGEIGFGLEVKMGRLRVFPEVNYIFGITPFVNETFTLGENSFVADDQATVNHLLLHLGISLN